MIKRIGLITIFLVLAVNFFSQEIAVSDTLMSNTIDSTELVQAIKVDSTAKITTDSLQIQDTITLAKDTIIQPTDTVIPPIDTVALPTTIQAEEPLEKVIEDFTTKEETDTLHTQETQIKKTLEVPIETRKAIDIKPPHVKDEEALSKAFSLYQEGNYEAAAKLLEPLAERKFSERACAKLFLAEMYYLQYRFDEALELVDSIECQTYDKAFHKTLKRQCLTGQKMLRSVNDVEFLDSVVVDKADFMKYYPQGKDIGYISQENDTQRFITGRENLQISAFRDPKGHSDLYRSDKFLYGWGEKQHLEGDINSDFDEAFPFLLPDGVTLYFASNDTTSLGGYDLFVSTQNSEGRFLRPQNIGMPFNSPFNDYMLVIDEVSELGFFASDRYQPEDKVAIYAFAYKPSYEKIDLSQDSLSYQTIRTIDFKKLKSIFANIQQGSGNAESEVQTKLFSFTIHSNKVYSNYSDFKSSEALDKFHEWEQVQQDISLSERALAEGRKAYAMEDDEIRRTSMGKTILQEEYKLIKLKAKSEELSKEIRELELSKS